MLDCMDGGMQKTDKTDSSNVENEKGPTEMDTVRLALLQGVLSTQQHEADHSGDDSDCEDSGSGGGDEEEDPDEARPFNEKIDSSEGGKLSGAELDGVAVNRRAKRLAMNRESARNRRKRKKVLVQTLEVQVAELNKSNQQYQLSNDALTIRVRTLENELAIAHNTIRQLSNASKNSSAFGGGILHAQLQQHFGSSVSSHLPMTAAAMAALAAFRNTQHDTLDPSFRAVPAAPNQDLQRSTIVAGGGGGVSGDNLSRLMQAQYEQYGLASGSPGLPFAPPGAAAAGVSGVSSRNDDPPLRHAMDLQALSQANSSASPSRFVTTNPFGPTVDRNQYGLGGMQSDLFQNMRSSSQEIALGDSNRLRINLPGSASFHNRPTVFSEGLPEGNTTRGFGLLAHTRGGDVRLAGVGGSAAGSGSAADIGFSGGMPNLPLQQQHQAPPQHVLEELIRQQQMHQQQQMNQLSRMHEKGPPKSNHPQGDR